MADELKAQMTQLEAAVAEYKLKHGKMPGEEPEPFSVRLQQDNLELIQQKRELRARIAALEAENIELKQKFADGQTIVAGLSDLLKKEGAECARLREDAERLDWLDGPDRHVVRRPKDKVRSDPCVEKAVTFFVNGRFTIVEGATTRAAIDAARREKT